MGTKNSPGNFDCYSNALDDEPMFILLARDRHAPEAVLRWCDSRELEIRRGYIGDKRKVAAELQQLAEARDCAKAMNDWRTSNMGVWRGAVPLKGKIVDDIDTTPVQLGFLAETPPMLTPEAADDEYDVEVQDTEHYNLDGLRG